MSINIPNLNNLENQETNKANQLFMNDNDDEQRIKEFKIIKKKVKINGCSTPFTLYQIISWIVFIAQAIWIFYIFREFFKDSNTQYIIYLSLNGAFFLLILIFGGVTTFCNPIDDMITKQEQGIQIDDCKKTHQCKICNLFVDQKTKHCGVCNKCVFEFDHHCDWLNNCVGSKNYKYFILLVCSLIGELLVSISFASYSLSLYNDDFHTYVERSGFQLSYKVFFGLSLAVIIVDFFCFLFCLQLVLYHSWLYLKGMSTYEHIIQNRKKQQEKAKHKIDYKKSNKIQEKNQNILDQTKSITNNCNQTSGLNQNLEMTSNIQKVNQFEGQQQQNFVSNQLNQTNDAMLNQKQNNIPTRMQYCNDNFDISVYAEQNQEGKLNLVQYSNNDEAQSIQNSQMKEFTPNMRQSKHKDNLSQENDTQNEIERQNEDAQTQQTHLEILDQVAIIHGRKLLQNNQQNNNCLRKSCSDQLFNNNLENQIKIYVEPARQNKTQNLTRVQSANSKNNSSQISAKQMSSYIKSQVIKIQPFEALQIQQQHSQSFEVQSIEQVSNNKISNEIIFIKQQNFF